MRHPILRLAALALFATAACAGEAGEGKKVGVLWCTSSSMADRVVSAFVAATQKLAPGLEVEVKGRIKTPEEAGKLYDEWQGSKNAVVYLRSDGASWMAKNPPKVPGFCGVCNDPAQIGLIKNAAAPEGNVTGVTYAIKAEKHFALYRQIWPALKAIGIILQEGHAGTPVDQAETKEACAKLGIAYHEVLIKDKGELAAAVETLKGKGAELLILGNQGKVFDNAGMVATAAGTTPVMSYFEKPITGKQALGGLVVDDAVQGQKLAEAVVAVVVGGKKIADVPVYYEASPRVVINLAKAKQLNLAIPEAVLKDAVKIE